MPRQVRIQFPGALYHVMCRGDRREPIFKDDQDREIFLRTLAEAARSNGWLIHAYVLMKNHYHLLLETPEPNLVKGMTWFQTTYTMRYNARHRTSGHVFGGRYKAIVLEGGMQSDYFRTLLDYIHLNPVRAGLIRFSADTEPDLLSFRWSSLPLYAGAASKRPPYLAVRDAFAAFRLKDGSIGRRKFVARLTDRAMSEKRKKCGLAEIEGQGLQSTLRRGWCYGSPGFKERMLSLADTALKKFKQQPRSGSSYSGQEMHDHGEEAAKQILEVGLKAYGIESKDLLELSKGHPAKGAIAAEIRARTSVPRSWVTEKLSMGTPGNIRSAVLKHTGLLKRSKSAKSQYKKFLEMIEKP
ncbi:transposase [Verrucomicrobiales bacterium]|nr:transposase [Verrucomicrobiales bacterium]